MPGTVTAAPAAPAKRATWFQRFLLPGFAFKAVVIGGGYATGRELAEFFLPAGPWGGLAAIALATLAWSLICALTFLLAHRTAARDYRSFFARLLGRGAIVFEIAYALFLVLILAVFGAAAGEIGAATLGLPRIAGTLALMVAIAGVAAYGNSAVERLFTWVSVLLYGVYAALVVLVAAKFGDRITAAFAGAEGLGEGWAIGGLTYAGYNVLGAVVILPVTRHFTSDRDAVTAGVIAGPLAMVPALLFFACMMAFMPGIAAETLPSDRMLRALDLPVFHLLFQLMIFGALLESGTGIVHAVNERVATAWEARRGTPFGPAARGAMATGLLVFCVLVAERVGLVALIANGYRALAYAVIAIYVLPLLTIGVALIARRRRLEVP